MRKVKELSKETKSGREMKEVCSFSFQSTIHGSLGGNDDGETSTETSEFKNALHFRSRSVGLTCFGNQDQANPWCPEMDAYLPHGAYMSPVDIH